MWYLPKYLSYCTYTTHTLLPTALCDDPGYLDRNLRKSNLNEKRMTTSFEKRIERDVAKTTYTLILPERNAKSLKDFVSVVVSGGFLCVLVFSFFSGGHML